MTVQQARVVLSAEDRFSQTFAAFKRQMAGGNTALQGFQTNIASLGLSLGALGAGISVAGAFSFVKSLADDLDALNDSADAVGDTVEALSALENVARRNGGNLDLVTSSLVKLNQQLSDTKADNPASRALRAIGLDAAALRASSPSEALRQIAVALQGYEDNANKARLVQELFGKSVREVAPFLKDLADAGELNATVTSEQAAAAERFNKQLAATSTQVGNVARQIAGELLDSFQRITGGIDSSDASAAKFSGTARALAVPLEAVAVLGANVAFTLRGVGREIGGIAAQAASLATGNFRGVSAIRAAMLEDAARERADLDEFEKRVLGLGSADAGTQSSQRDALRRIEAATRRTVGDFGASTTGGAGARGKSSTASTQVSEAERYLETLQKQADKTRELTTYEQALADIQRGRIGGLTPEIEAQIRATAKLVDDNKALTDLKEKQVGLDKLIADALERDSGRTSALIGDSYGGQVERAQADIARLREALNAPENQNADAAGRILEALERIKDGVAPVTTAVESEFDKIANVIEKTMDGATAAVLDFALEGKGSVGDLGRAFSRDILRAIIEDPIRDTMKAAVKQIRDAFKGVEGGGAGGGLGGLFGDIASSIGSSLGSLFGGFGSRANGGPVSAGSVYRVNENGTEFFQPDRDGYMLNAQQTRQRGQAAAPVVHYAPTLHVNGDVSPKTVQLVESMLARDRANLLRSMQTGGAYAA